MYGTQLHWRVVGRRTIFGVHLLFFWYFFLQSLPYFFSFSLPRRNVYPGPLNRLVSPLLTTVRAFNFMGRILQPCSSLVDMRRVMLTHAIKRSRHLVSLENTNQHAYRDLEPLTPTLVVFEINH